MKKFCFQVVMIFISVILLLTFFYFVLFEKREKLTSTADEVFFVFDKALRTNDKRTVYVGDSVCEQLFSAKEDDEDVCHLGSNAALQVMGNYFLLKEYLNNNPQTEQVVYFIRPNGFQKCIDSEFTYQYLVIPVLDKETLSSLDELEIENLHGRYGKTFTNNEFVKYILCNNNVLMQAYLKSVGFDEPYVNHMSPLCAKYLLEISRLCDEKGCRFTIAPCPLPDTKENHDWTLLQKDFYKYDVDGILKDYIDGIEYYPEDWFYDGVHFYQEILDEYGDKIREEVKKD